ncbi:hypothetical protein [Nocardioides campestrisoli]|uniref:hypothetical protein n=1 Tax=Nocardioides campestrisoli TaxID=2736757 RepID=UPI00163DB8B3|nr:hypothetical protein [Nocardioides campestrisoli]
MSLAQNDELAPLLPGPLELVLGLGLLLVPLLLLGLLVRRRGARRLGREARLVALVRGTGILLGAALAVSQLSDGGIVPSPGLWVDAIHAPILFGLATLLAAVLGELVVRPRFDAGPRTADLRPRRVRDFLPPGLTRLVAGLGVCAAALCSFTWLTASADDMGRDGRALWAACTAAVSSTRSPYPGSFYVVPYALGVAVALAVAAAAAWQVTRRPLGGTPAEADHHRRTSMQAIVGALGVVVSAPMIGLALVAGTTLLQHACPRPGWGAVGCLALAVGALALVALVASLVALLTPPAPRPVVREQETARA